MSNPHEIIEASIEKILHLMDFSDATISIKEEIDSKTDVKTFLCSLKTQKDSRFLIGQHGSNLYALEHIIRSILNKDGFLERINLDINGYKEDKDRMITHIAKDAADQAHREKKPIILRPMNAYERRIVHTTISGDMRVETESIGEKDDRKVIVKPRGIMQSL
ncbi:MAG: R3H domain-containing nucleic acid-binding protein [Parcubacteria group bacterium]|jgi:spoIIIJ-associated protein